jgi:hypothetical protein
MAARSTAVRAVKPVSAGRTVPSAKAGAVAPASEQRTTVPAVKAGPFHIQFDNQAFSPAPVIGSRSRGGSEIGPHSTRRSGAGGRGCSVGGMRSGEADY